MAASTAASAYDWIEDAIAAIAKGPADAPAQPPAEEVSPPTAVLEAPGWFQFSAIFWKFFSPQELQVSLSKIIRALITCLRSATEVNFFTKFWFVGKFKKKTFIKKLRLRRSVSEKIRTDFCCRSSNAAAAVISLEGTIGVHHVTRIFEFHR